MPSGRTTSAPQLFSELQGPVDSEFASVLRTADPGPALNGPLTFLPGPGISDGERLRAWSLWQAAPFAGIIAPVLVETATLAERGGAREILALDLRLDAALAPDARERSVAAGRGLLTRLASSRGERCLGKFQQWVAGGEMPVHFATIHAVHHAVFHLPLRLLVPAYAYWEWCAAGGSAPAFAQESAPLCRLAQDLLSSLSPNHAVPTFPAASGDR